MSSHECPFCERPKADSRPTCGRSVCVGSFLLELVRLELEQLEQDEGGVVSLGAREMRDDEH